MVLQGPCTRDTPSGGRERGATGAFGRGVAATPLLHTQNCRMSRDRGVATPWSATGGVVTSAPLSLAGSTGFKGKFEPMICALVVCEKRHPYGGKHARVP